MVDIKKILKDVASKAKDISEEVVETAKDVSEIVVDKRREFVERRKEAAEEIADEKERAAQDRHDKEFDNYSDDKGSADATVVDDRLKSERALKQVESIIDDSKEDEFLDKVR